MSFVVRTSGVAGVTQVPNDILLHNILNANGEHIKVYLYLLMAAQNPGIAGEVSVETLADRMDYTERDIVRILHYWEREGLLSLTDTDGGIDGITLEHPVRGGDPPGNYGGGYRAPVVYGNEPAEPPQLRVVKAERTEFTPSQIQALARDAEMQQTLSSVESSLGEPISPMHMQLVMYLTCDLGFTGDLITYLYRLGADRHKLKPRYLETIALDWADKGIRTVREAMAESADFAGKYRPIKQALGFHRDLAPAEKEIIDSWDDYDLPTEIIEEACRRTVIQTGDTNLKYVTKILEGWHKQGVRTLADVQRADEAFQKNKPKRARTVRRGHPSGNSFQNFKQRDYTDEDYEDMERQFLQRKGTQ